MVMLIIGIIFAVTLPRMSISTSNAFPLILKHAWRHVFVKAISNAGNLELSFKNDGINVSDKKYSYPDGIIPDREVNVFVNPCGFAAPARIWFYSGEEKVLVKVGLFGITVSKPG